MPVLDTIAVGNSRVVIYKVTNRGRPYLKLSYHFAGQWKGKLLANNGRKDVDRAKAVARALATKLAKSPKVAPDVDANLSTLNAATQALNGLDVPVDAACREYAQARTILGDSGSLLEAARMFRKSAKRAQRTATVPELVEQYLAALEADGIKGRHLQDTRSRLRKFSGDIKTRIDEVTSADMATWLRGLGVAPRTRNNFRSQLVTFFRWARTEGYLPRDVTTEAELLKTVATTHEIHIFQGDDLSRLVDEIAHQHDEAEESDKRRLRFCLHYVVIGSYAGVRPHELSRLTDKNIRFDHNDIEVRAAQAKRTRRRVHRRLTPLQPNLRAWLEYAPLETGPLIGSHTRNHVAAIVKALGIEWAHDIMRHSFISNAVALTQNVDQVALWSGNSRKIIYESYLSQRTEAEAKAYFAKMPPARSGKIIAMPKRGG
jgi:integrase